IRLRGGRRFEFSEQTDVFGISGRVSDTGVARPVVSGAGFGQPINTRRFTGETRDLLTIEETRLRTGGRSVQITRGTGVSSQVTTGLFGERNIFSESRDFGGFSVQRQTGQIFGSS